MNNINADSARPTPQLIRGGVGLGLRRELTETLLKNENLLPNFVEFAPENWMSVGGRWGRTLQAVSERYPILCHGLSLSIGSPEDLDYEFLERLKLFFERIPVHLYTEHLSYCKCDNAHVYDLLPIPFRKDAVRHIAARIRIVQDILERQIAIENVSYYTALAPEMDEATFVRAVLEESDCLLLLDVNNVYVNAFNHGYDAKQFIASLPLERVAQLHMAGHEQRSPDLIIDTHGKPIIDPVFELFEWTINHVAPVPVLLERDYNFEDIPSIWAELHRLNSIVRSKWDLAHAA